MHKLGCGAREQAEALWAALAGACRGLWEAGAHLLQALRNEVVQREGPVVAVCQHWGRLPPYQEDDPHWMHAPAWRRAFSHLNGTHAQGPDVHLEVSHR